MARISIVGQIAEAERELAMRRSVYPRQVGAGKMRQGEADMLLAQQESIIATLKWVQANEADIRAWIEAKKALRGSVLRGSGDAGAPQDGGDE